MKTLRYIVFLAILWSLIGCSAYQVSDDPSYRLSFSTDTLRFNTVFTEQGSATLQLKVYNRHSSAMRIDRVWVEDGSVFHVNVDGEQDLSRLTDLTIYGGDSLFVFVRLRSDELHSDDALLITDRLHFHLATDVTQDVVLEAFGQDVTRVGSSGCGRTQFSAMHLTADKPYVFYDTVVVDGPVTIDAGARIYMHQGACLYALGDITANGSSDAPIVFCGDRLDRLFDSVPYAYAGGSWNGIYCQAEEVHTYDLSYVDILSGNVGLLINSTCTGALPHLAMTGCRIHNHAQYGLVLLNTDAQVVNTEISNCASYCVYCDGGTHDFIHTTIASYFGYTNIRIQSVTKEETAAVYIDNLSKAAPATVTSFYNSIITGYRTNQLVVATPIDRFYAGSFIGNYLKTDTLRMPHAQSNTYWQSTDTAAVFVNDFYKYKEYIYYDFHLDSISPAIGVGDSLTAVPYPLDRDGVSRALTRPDAGCYQYRP